MDRPRVAFLSDKTAPEYVGGYEVRVFELARRLSDRFEVEILSSSPSARVDGATFRKVFPSTFQRFPTGERSRANTALCGVSSWGLGARLRSYDVVVVESIPYVHLPAVRWEARRGRPPVVLDVSEAWSDFRPSTSRLTLAEEVVVQRLLRGAVRSAAAVVAVSGATGRSLVRHYGVREADLRIVPNGVQPPPPGARHPSAPEFDFVSVARLVDHKRVGDFVQALGALRTRTGWTGRAAIVGDGPLREALTRLAEREHVSDHLRFFGFLRGAEKDGVVASSRIFVLPSEREGFSIAALEAMASGVPVLASRPSFDDVFGVGDLVEDDVTGRLYPTGDVRALSDRMERLLASETDRARLSDGARARSAAFTWDAAADRMAAVLGEVLGS